MNAWIERSLELAIGAALVGLGACTSAERPPSPEALCGRQCAAAEAAQCGAPDPRCDERCLDAAQTLPARCLAARDAALSCLAKASYRCGEDGEPEATSCGAERSALSRCAGSATAVDASVSVDDDASAAVDDDASAAGSDDASTSDGGRADAGPDATPPDGGGDGGARASCGTVCARVLAAGCADPGACSACEEVRILTPDSCRASLDALESCAAVETFTCNSAGQAESPVCDPLSASWARCVAGVYPNAFGIANPDLTSCQFLRDGTSCGECLALSCCTPFAACVEDPSCASLSTCAEACAGDSACFQGCERAHPGGVLLYLSLLSCTLGSCTSC